MSAKFRTITAVRELVLAGPDYAYYRVLSDNKKPFLIPVQKHVMNACLAVLDNKDHLLVDLNDENHQVTIYQN